MGLSFCIPCVSQKPSSCIPYRCWTCEALSQNFQVLRLVPAPPSSFPSGADGAIKHVDIDAHTVPVLTLKHCIHTCPLSVLNGFQYIAVRRGHTSLNHAAYMDIYCNIYSIYLLYKPSSFFTLAWTWQFIQFCVFESTSEVWLVESLLDSFLPLTRTHAHVCLACRAWQLDSVKWGSIS